MVIKKPTFIYYLEKKSIFFKIGFGIKFCIFFALSIIILISGNIYLKLIFMTSLLVFLGYIGFIKSNKSVIKFLLLSSTIFSCFRLLFSKSAGKILLVWPWKTYITDITIHNMILSVLTRCGIILVGIGFMAITSEDQLINFLLKRRFPRKLIFIISIALNTFNFSIKDIDTTNYALLSRRYDDKGLIKKIKKIFYIGVAILLSNLKKVDTLEQIFSLKEDEYNSK